MNYGAISFASVLWKPYKNSTLLYSYECQTWHDIDWKIWTLSINLGLAIDAVATKTMTKWINLWMISNEMEKGHRIK